MSKLNTQILVHRVKDHHGAKESHQAYECTVRKSIDFHNDLVELVDACERMQLAENILHKLIDQPLALRSQSGILISVANLTPQENEYLNSLHG